MKRRPPIRDRYTYRVTWSPEDGAHVGLCVECPSLSWLAATPNRAFSGIRSLVAEVLRDLEAAGEHIPPPLADRPYSGRFLVRLPPEVHRALALRAAEEGVSLNRLVSARLSGGIAPRETAADLPSPSGMPTHSVPPIP